MRGPVEDYIFQKHVKGGEVSRWEKFLVEDVGMTVLSWFGVSFGLDKIKKLKELKSSHVSNSPEMGSPALEQDGD